MIESEKPTEIITKTENAFSRILPILEKNRVGALYLMLLLVVLALCGIGFLMAWRIQNPEKLFIKQNGKEICIETETGTFCKED